MFERRKLKNYRPVDTPKIRACLAELRAVATRYQAINDQLAEIHRNIQLELNEIDQTTPVGAELFEIGRALTMYHRPSVTALTVLTVRHMDFGAEETINHITDGAGTALVGKEALHG